jgi:hypothetical protein
MATLSQVGIAGVGYGILMPKLKNRWRVTFLGIGGGADPWGVSMQAVTVTRPSLSFEEVQIDRYNSRAYVAGKHTWDMMNLSVEDDITNSCTTVIQAQLEKQQRLIGASGPWLNTEGAASNYKFGTKLTMLDGNELVTEEWLIEGCHLNQVNWNELDYAASEAVRIDLQIRFDHARQVISGTSGLGTAIGGLL